MGASSPPTPPDVRQALPLGPPLQIDWSSTPLTTVLTNAERASLAMDLKRQAARLTTNLNALPIPDLQRQALTLTVRQFLLLTDTLNENMQLHCEQTVVLLKKAQQRSHANDRMLLLLTSAAVVGWGAAVVLAFRLVEALAR